MPLLLTPRMCHWVSGRRAGWHPCLALQRGRHTAQTQGSRRWRHQVSKHRSASASCSCHAPACASTLISQIHLGARLVVICTLNARSVSAWHALAGGGIQPCHGAIDQAALRQRDSSTPLRMSASPYTSELEHGERCSATRSGGSSRGSSRGGGSSKRAPEWRQYMPRTQHGLVPLLRSPQVLLHMVG